MKMVKESSGAMAKPAWLEALLSETFFDSCELHQTNRKNEKNFLCLICCQSLCNHCLAHHHSHPVLQVRRYVYQDVIQLEDLQKLIDCSHIQPYTINKAKVIFLKPRAQSRSSYKGSGNNTCFTCERFLQEPFRLCSLSCKVENMVDQGDDFSSMTYGFDESEFHFSHFQELEIDQNTPSNLDNEFEGSSSCTGQDRGSSEFSQQMMLSFHSRRKGAPHRSPLA